MTITHPVEGNAELGTTVAVEVDGVEKRYGAKRAVAGVSLRIRRGEFFGLLGPNGAGKSTLLEIMEGLREADAGRISVLGLSPTPRNPKLLTRIGVQTQSAAFFPGLTAREHLETVVALYGKGNADEALELVGLTESAHTRVTKLSGGQRQRLAIAGALAHGPDLIFLDEPTAALDPQARRELWDVLRELKRSGRTIVYTTHHLDEAQILCDRVGIIVDGRIIALDTPHALARAIAPDRLYLPAGRISVAEAEALDGVGSVHTEGDRLVLTTHSLAVSLNAAGRLIDLADVETRAATLEDAYLDLIAKEQTR